MIGHLFQQTYALGLIAAIALGLAGVTWQWRRAESSRRQEVAHLPVVLRRNEAETHQGANQ